MDAAQAAAETARQKVKRAAGLLRDAARDLAAAADGDTPLGVSRVHDHETARAALDLIQVGAARYGAVDVIVIARPTRRAAAPTHHDPADAG